MLRRPLTSIELAPDDIDFMADCMARNLGYVVKEEDSTPAVPPSFLSDPPMGTFYSIPYVPPRDAPSRAGTSRAPAPAPPPPRVVAVDDLSPAMEIQQPDAQEEDWEEDGGRQLILPPDSSDEDPEYDDEDLMAHDDQVPIAEGEEIVDESPHESLGELDSDRYEVDALEGEDFSEGIELDESGDPLDYEGGRNSGDMDEDSRHNLDPVTGQPNSDPFGLNQWSPRSVSSSHVSSSAFHHQVPRPPTPPRPRPPPEVREHYFRLIRRTYRPENYEDEDEDEEVEEELVEGEPPGPSSR